MYGYLHKYTNMSICIYTYTCIFIHIIPLISIYFIIVIIDIYNKYIINYVEYIIKL